jgi:uncharacterized repeat protein (TIGR02543 family)
MRPKRLISLLVAVCMMITMLPLSAVTAFAADTASSTEQEISVGDYKYAYTVNADGSTATITEFRGPVDPKNTGPYDIDIPEKLGNYTVTVLGEDSFSTDDFDSPLYDIHHTKIHSVTIPQSVTSIGKDAFAQCRALQSLTIDDAATSIGDWTFDECYKLTTLSLGEKIKTIGDYAFYDCRILNNVTIPQSVTSIGDHAFGSCYGMDSFTIKDATTSIGKYAFSDCQSLTTLSLGENITTIGDDAFRSCYKLETITLPAGLASFGNCLIGCPAGRKWDYHGNPINPIGAIYYNNDWDHAKELPGYNVLKNRNFLYLCKVTFDAKGGTLTDDPEVPVYKTEKITDTKANDLTAIHDPTRAGYKFTGWYTDKDQLFDVKDTAIMEDITLHAGWDFDPNAPVCHPLTLKDGVITSVTVPGKDGADPEDITEIVKKNANEDGSFNVPEGATVSVAFDKDAFADSGLKFGHWDITGLDDPNAYQNKESFAFVMPAKGVTLKAMTQDASIEDDEPDIVGPIVIGTTVVVGGAVLGYQAYSLGAEFAGKLMALPYFPSNRSALAMMLWEDAGKPMPESELLYPDVGQEEQDMDLQHAARWAMENELIPDLNDEGTAPEEMKFYPDNTVSKIDVLKAWQKAQELKQNA